MSRAGAHPFSRKLVLVVGREFGGRHGLTQAGPQVHVDIAALIHDLPDMLSRESDIAEMCEVLADAGRRIGGEAQSVDIGCAVVR